MEQLFASFMLDQTAGLEIALRAEDVTEATPTRRDSGPSGKYLISLRNHALTGRSHSDHQPEETPGTYRNGYGTGAKVAVVKLLNTRYGLLFDDIKEVFRVDQAHIRPVTKVLQSEDRIISALISLETGNVPWRSWSWTICSRGLFGGGESKQFGSNRRCRTGLLFPVCGDLLCRTGIRGAGPVLAGDYILLGHR